MNEELFRREFADKKILIWGYGREGKSSCALIHACCPEMVIDVTDGAWKSDEDCRHIDRRIRCRKESDTDFFSYDLILKSPGIVIPEKLSALQVSSQTQLFLKHFAAQTVGVTGTKGKSTTASLIAAALSEVRNVHLVGNIGIPCFDAALHIAPDDLAVFEISCHQLQYTAYSPHIAVYLNLFEEHLDHYGSFEAYGNAKDQIFLHQRQDDVLIIHSDLKDRVPASMHPILIRKDVYAEGHVLHIPDRALQVDSCALIGSHNYDNLAVAYYIASALYHVDDESFLAACAHFKPLAHRLEDLGEYHDIRFVDDSISTIGQSCISALKALPDTETVLIGGMDRGIEYNELEEYLSSRSDLQVIFMYASGHRIHAEMLQKGMSVHAYLCENLEEAAALAKKITAKHRTVLLSPAASSYDHFRNFEERGDWFHRYAEL